MTDQAQRTFADLHHAVADLAGARLFTVTRIDHAQALARRIYTSHPVDYPTSGTKPVQPDGWTRQVIDGQRSFVANMTADFAIYFPDHALINRLGCQSALNVPIVDAGVTVAAVNILDNAGRFTPRTVSAVEALLHSQHASLITAIRASPLG